MALDAVNRLQNANGIYLQLCRSIFAIGIVERRLDTYSRHKYEEWDLGLAQFPGAPAGTQLEGNELERAPKYYQTYIVDYHPKWMKGGKMELEVIYMGSYFTDAQNSDKYGGHELVNFRIQYPLTKQLLVYGRLMNVFDRENTSYTSSSAETGFTPGEPRAVFVGMEYTF